MSLRATAEADLAISLEDPNEYGMPVQVLAPDGRKTPPIGADSAAHTAAGGVFGMTRDSISELFDVNTGQGHSARTVQIGLRLSTLAKWFDDDVPEESRTNLGWRIVYADLQGKQYRVRVMKGDPDRTIGYVFCTCERFER